MSKTTKILGFFEKELEDVLSLASEIKFDSNHALHQHVVSLYGSVIELSSSIKVLYKSGHYSTISLVLRTILEAFVDLRNLCRDPKYGYSLTINSYKESLNFLKTAKDDQNVYTEMTARDPNVDQHIANIEKKNERLKSNGYKGINIRGKFEKADMLDDYLTIYNMLCADTHNDIRALRARHMVIGEDSFSLEFFKQEDTEAMYNYLGIASELLLRATYEIHSLLDSGKDKELQSLRDDLNQIRGDS
ncbi:MAG: hypothetical protein JRE12_11065 [Deltaproteobacteria bacterium]|nr:hypothetical protein [Deltaproteobacteria bacterium]